MSTAEPAPSCPFPHGGAPRTFGPQGRAGVSEALREATAILEGAGVPSPRTDAELLAAHVLRCRRADLVLFDTLPASTYFSLVARRAEREPLQHVTGVAHFRYLTLAVGPGVFVPRAETEVVAGWAVDALRASGWPSPLVVDLGTGSGAIALALATEVPGARVHAVEADEQAYAWSARNLTGSGVVLHRGDLADALHELDGTVDLVVSNPPYVPETVEDQLDPEVLTHDPARALWGGPDGLDVIRAVERTARRLLRRGGVVVVEHDDTHGSAAPDVFSGPAWDAVRDHVDLADRPRFVTASRR